MDGYLSSKASGDQTEFFVELEQTWFVRWPEEAACGLPHNDSGIALDPDQKEALGNATAKRKLQLRSWFRNNNDQRRNGSRSVSTSGSKKNTLSGVIGHHKQRRARQLVEVYQTNYPERIQEELACSAPDLTVNASEGHESASDKAKRLSAIRLGQRRAVAMQMLEEESDDVKAELKAELEKEARLRAEAKAELLETSPASVQMSLDELDAVVAQFHSMLTKTTGWAGFAMYGGPTPRSGGELTARVYSCGRTPQGNHTFKQSHPTWKTDVSGKFNAWLKLCFTRADRLKLALPVEDDWDAPTSVEDDVQEEDVKPPSKKSTTPKLESTIYEGVIDFSQSRASDELDPYPSAPLDVPAMTSNDWVMDSHLGLGGDPTGFDNDFLAPGGDPTEFESDDHSSHPNDGWSNYVISSTGVVSEGLPRSSQRPPHPDNGGAASGGRSNEVSLQLSPASIEPIGQWFEESATIYNGPEEAQQAPIVPAAPRTSNSTLPVAQPRPRPLFLARASAPSPGAAAAEGTFVAFELAELDTFPSQTTLRCSITVVAFLGMAGNAATGRFVQPARGAIWRPITIGPQLPEPECNELSRLDTDLCGRRPFPTRSLDIFADDCVELSKLDAARPSLGITTKECAELSRADAEPCRWPPPPARSLDAVADKRVELTKVDAKPAHSSVGVTKNERAGLSRLDTEPCRWPPPPARSLDAVADKRVELTKVDAKPAHSSVGVTTNERVDDIIAKLSRSSPTPLSLDIAAGECKELNVKLALCSVRVTANEQAELVARSTPTAARDESATTAT
ncbi:hypothetical protein B0H14DRAFT_3483733 [Mycena olivaceomarginata]|nr:hypothetical protein B0H14DRAFT_3483733 [Mycena olivaceomarginata]